MIISKDGYYLTVTEDGEVKGEKPKEGSKAPIRLANWTIYLRNNIKERKMVYSFDEVLIKSSYGNFLKVEEDGTVNAYSSNITEKCTWHIQKAKVPF